MGKGGFGECALVPGFWGSRKYHSQIIAFLCQGSTKKDFWEEISVQRGGGHLPKPPFGNHPCANPRVGFSNFQPVSVSQDRKFSRTEWLVRDTPSSDPKRNFTLVTLSHPFPGNEAHQLLLRSQEKGILAKGVSAESTVTPKQTKHTQGYWAPAAHLALRAPQLKEVHMSATTPFQNPPFLGS